ncbi:hypothetical protein GQ607_007744, partial [Colletotrichum asianum]
ENYIGDYQFDFDLGDDFNLGSDFPYHPAISSGNASSENSEGIWSADWVGALSVDFYANPNDTHQHEATDIDCDWVPEDVYQMGYQDELAEHPLSRHLMQGSVQSDGQYVSLMLSHGSVSQSLTAFSDIEEPCPQDASAKAEHIISQTVPKQGQKRPIINHGQQQF